MLDHRSLLPLGTALVKKDDLEEVGIAIYMRNKPDLRRVLPSIGRQAGMNMVFVVPDITDAKHESKGQVDNIYDPHREEIRKANADTNVVRAGRMDFPERDVVVLVGGSPFLTDEELEQVEKIRNKVIVVVIGKPVKEVRPDYCVISDALEDMHEYYGQQDLSNVTAFLNLCVHPLAAELAWKGIGWYRNTTYNTNGLHIPCYRSSETVATDAIQFVFKELKAKKLIMLGMSNSFRAGSRHPYFWDGIFTQAFCYFFSRSGKEIWNCTDGTSLLSGVILGSLDEALEGINHG